MNLLYFADPMCSWCYGFGPELSKLLARHPEARLDLVMGGLRPYNTQAMSAEFRQMLRGHWGHVAQASGLAFSESILARDDFVYDTEPACRAVVAAREADPAKAYALLEAVQAGFYRDGRDVTQGNVLADIAAECGYERAAFAASFESQAVRDKTRADFAQSQSMGVGGFPTLGVGLRRELFLVTSGYATADVLDERLAQIERLAAAR